MSHLSPLLKQSSDVIAERGEGCYIYDAANRAWLDFTSGIGVTATGHCHPRVVAAAQEQVGRLIHAQYASVKHQPMLDLADLLSEHLPSPLDSVSFTNSGSEAVETAMRLARQATGRANMICFHGGFHGRTVGAASMTTSATKVRSGYHPLMGGVVFAPFPHPYRYGMTEEEAAEEFGEENVRVDRFPFNEQDRALIEGRNEGLIKLVYKQKFFGIELKGAHIVGPSAGELIHEFVLAMNNGISPAGISGTTHVYPTLSQSVKRATDEYFSDVLFQGWIPWIAKKYLNWTR